MTYAGRHGRADDAAHAHARRRRGAQAWVDDDPDPDTRAELARRPAPRPRRATEAASPTSPTGSPGCSSSARRGCAARSAPDPTG